MPGRICYLGDDDLGQAAIYLAGIMEYFGLEYDHVPSTERPPAGWDAEPYALHVLSDYPAARFAPGQLEWLAERISEGAGFIMLGGWESFHGRLGEYHRTALAEVLPVVMQDHDDRQNRAQPCLVKALTEHPILSGVPLDAPPGIGGFNALAPKPDAETLLASVSFSVRREGETFRFTPAEESPLLVVGRYGKGRTAALATDVAPHWVGGWVDWGDARVIQEVAGGFIDVGNWYAQFFRNLLVWTGQLDRNLA